MEEYIVSLRFEGGFSAEALAVSAPDDAMAVRVAIAQCCAVYKGEGVAIVQHRHLPGAIKYNILT